MAQRWLAKNKEHRCRITNAWEFYHVQKKLQVFLANTGAKDFLISMPFNSKLFSPKNGNKCNSFELTVLTLHAKLTCKYSHLLTPKLDVITVNAIQSFHLNIEGKSKTAKLWFYI